MMMERLIQRTGKPRATDPFQPATRDLHFHFIDAVLFCGISAIFLVRNNALCCVHQETVHSSSHRSQAPFYSAHFASKASKVLMCRLA
jgi:hypothetical protein